MKIQISEIYLKIMSAMGGNGVCLGANELILFY